MSNKKALDGLKVIDLSRVLAGPSCTQILADFGAEVIKIEKPISGDETRHWAPPEFPNGISAYFSTVNRNKKSVTVDISTPEGQKIIHNLLQDADVLVENFKVGSLSKYGLDYQSLKAYYPKLVYCSLTGFGQDGPDAKKPGYDYIIQGLSGLMSITGPEEGLPYKVGVAVVDIVSGLNLTIGLQMALLAREKTGLGQHVDISLLDSAISLLANVGMNYLATDQVPTRLGNGHANIVPYNTFQTKDKNGESQYFILACGNDHQFSEICHVMGTFWDQELEFKDNPSRVRNREQLLNLMQEVLLTKERDEWLALFTSAKVPCGPIHNIAEALSMPQVQYRQMIVNFSDNDIKVLGNPIKLSDTPVTYHSPPPELGEHTHEVLAQYLCQEDINKLIQKGII